MTIKEDGIITLDKVIDHFSKNYSKSRIAILETYGYHESIMTTAFLHVLKDMKKDVILWGINKSIYKQFDSFSMNAGCVIFNMPDGSSKSDRSLWYDYVQSKKITIFSTHHGLIKAGKYKPFIPTTNEDQAWFDNFVATNKIAKPIVIAGNNSNIQISDNYTVLSYNCKLPNSIEISDLKLQQLKICSDFSKFVVTYGESIFNDFAKCDDFKSNLFSDCDQDKLNKVII